jgi:hypothetical protein
VLHTRKIDHTESLRPNADPTTKASRTEDKKTLLTIAAERASSSIDAPTISRTTLVSIAARHNMLTPVMEGGQ